MSDQQAPGVVQALRVLRERWWVIVLAALVCTGTALAFSLSAEKEYTATSKLLFRESNLPEQVGGSSGPTDVDPEGTKATNVLLVTTRQVADAVRRATGVKLSADDLLGNVSVDTEQNANIVDINYTDPDPALAAKVANSWAQQYRNFSQRSARGKVQEGERLLRERLAQLPATATADRQQLNDALTRLVLLESVQTGNADVVDRAAVPSTPSAPSPKRDAMIALLLGLALGTGLAFLLNIIDRRVKNVEEFESLYGFRALSTIPERSRDPSSQKERQAALEPFRILRNGLSFLAVRRDVKCVLVTSAVPGEGKSTVAAGLARATALAGQRVVLVEADLRRPTFHQQFDLGPDHRGLTAALVGGVPARELLRTVLPGLRTLSVLPAGPLPPNSAELLRSAEMGMLLRELSQEADLVILDAPPLLPVADAQVLLDHPQVDGCLVVARAYQTTRDEVRRARAILERHGLEGVGLVINGVRELDGDYDYYGTSDHSASGAVRLTPSA
jgi:capsular exopolysaccharide synthesis family protein